MSGPIVSREFAADQNIFGRSRATPTYRAARRRLRTHYNELHDHGVSGPLQIWTEGASGGKKACVAEQHALIGLIVSRTANCKQRYLGPWWPRQPREKL